MDVFAQMKNTRLFIYYLAEKLPVSRWVGR